MAISEEETARNQAALDAANNIQSDNATNQANSDAMDADLAALGAKKTVPLATGIVGAAENAVTGAYQSTKEVMSELGQYQLESGYDPSGPGNNIPATASVNDQDYQLSQVGKAGVDFYHDAVTPASFLIPVVGEAAGTAMMLEQAAFNGKSNPLMNIANNLLINPYSKLYGEYKSGDIGNEWRTNPMGVIGEAASPLVGLGFAKGAMKAASGFGLAALEDAHPIKPYDLRTEEQFKQYSDMQQNNPYTYEENRNAGVYDGKMLSDVEGEPQTQVPFTDSEQLMHDFIDHYKVEPADILTELETERQRLIDEQYQSLKDNNGGKKPIQGNIATDDEGDVTTQYGRESRNPVWYQEAFADLGHKPTNKEMKIIAESQLRDGYNHEIGIIEPHPDFQALEDAIDGIKQYQAKLEASGTKRTGAENSGPLSQEARSQATDYGRAISDESRQSAGGNTEPAQTVNAFSDNPQDINNKTWYHGTGTDGLAADDLSTHSTKIEGLYGHGVYLTDNPDIAKGYAGSRGKKTGSPTVYQAKVNINKVLDYH